MSKDAPYLADGRPRIRLIDAARPMTPEEARAIAANLVAAADAAEAWVAIKPEPAEEAPIDWSRFCECPGPGRGLHPRGMVGCEDRGERLARPGGFDRQLRDYLDGDGK